MISILLARQLAVLFLIMGLRIPSGKTSSCKIRRKQDSVCDHPVSHHAPV